jgi:hypothetical protein
MVPPEGVWEAPSNGCMFRATSLCPMRVNVTSLRAGMGAPRTRGSIGRSLQCAFVGARNVRTGEEHHDPTMPPPDTTPNEGIAACPRRGSKHERGCGAYRAASRRRPRSQARPRVAGKLSAAPFRPLSRGDDGAPGGRQPSGAPSVESLHRRGPEASRRSGKYRGRDAAAILYYVASTSPGS